jgi:hypothetical protein
VLSVLLWLNWRSLGEGGRFVPVLEHLASLSLDRLQLEGACRSAVYPFTPKAVRVVNLPSLDGLFGFAVRQRLKIRCSPNHHRYAAS